MTGRLGVGPLSPLLDLGRGSPRRGDSRPELLAVLGLARTTRGCDAFAACRLASPSPVELHLEPFNGLQTVLASAGVLAYLSVDPLGEHLDPKLVEGVLLGLTSQKAAKRLPGGELLDGRTS